MPHTLLGARDVREKKERVPALGELTFIGNAEKRAPITLWCGKKNPPFCGRASYARGTLRLAFEEDGQGKFPGAAIYDLQERVLKLCGCDAPRSLFQGEHGHDVCDTNTAWDSISTGMTAINHPNQVWPSGKQWGNDNH